MACATRLCPSSPNCACESEGVACTACNNPKWLAVLAVLLLLCRSSSTWSLIRTGTTSCGCAVHPVAQHPVCAL